MTEMIIAVMVAFVAGAASAVVGLVFGARIVWRCTRPASGNLFYNPAPKEDKVPKPVRAPRTIDQQWSDVMLGRDDPDDDEDDEDEDERQYNV